MASRERFTQLLVICLLFVQDSQQQVQKPVQVRLIDIMEKQVSCTKGKVVVVTAVIYNINNRETHPCQKIGVGIMNSFCKFNEFCRLKKSEHCRSKTHTVYTVDITLHCIRIADVHRGCRSRIDIAHEQSGYGIIASENYPAANASPDCGFKFVLQNGMAIKLTILDCFYEATVDNTKLCDSNTKLPVMKMITTDSWVKYQSIPRHYRGFLAVYSGRFLINKTGEEVHTTTAAKHYLAETSSDSTQTEKDVETTRAAKQDLAGTTQTETNVRGMSEASTESGTSKDQGTSGKNNKHGLVIGSVLLSVVVVLMVAGSCFLYQRLYKPRNKNDSAPEEKYQPPRLSFRLLNRNPDGDQAEVMYDTIHDGGAQSSDETQKYICVEYQTCPRISDEIIAGSNSGPDGVSDRKCMDVNISGASSSTSNDLPELTELTQQVPLYAEVKRAETVVLSRKNNISPGEPGTGPLYAQVNKQTGGPVYAQFQKASSDKPDVGPVYAEVSKPKKRAASSGTSEGRSVYVTAQGVWNGTDAH